MPKNGSIIKYAKILYAGGGNTIYANNSLYIHNAEPFISHSIIEHSENIGILLSGPTKIYKCTISNNNDSGILLSSYSSPKITENIIYNNSCGIETSSGNTVNIHGNEIYNNNIGIYLYNTNNLIQNNIIKNNNIGIKIDFNGCRENNINNNNILDNNYNIKLRGAFFCNVNAIKNWWGTTNKAKIDENIYDYYDNLELGKVLYEPIATQPYDFSGGSITGTLKNYTTFEPITDGSVTCSGGQSTTNSTGQYKIENLTPGNYTLTASAPLYHSKTVENVEVHAGQETTQDFELEKMTTGALVGKVLNVNDLAPVENVQVDLQNTQNQYQDVTTTQGEFSFDDVKAGDYNLGINSTFYYGTSKNETIDIDKVTNSSLIAIPKSNQIVRDIQSGMYTEEEYSSLNASKNQQIQNLTEIINNQNQTISSLNQTITNEENKIVKLNNTISNMYTETELNAYIDNATENMINKNKLQILVKNATLEERKRWDVDGNNKTGLPEAIYSLKVISGTD